MRVMPIVLVLLSAAAAPARVLNVEFKFTPFTGDTKADHVTTVAGQARVFVNGLPLNDEPVEAKDVPVLFEEREIAPSVWVPVESLGSVVRKGKNTIRIEFEPTDAKAPYKAQLRWASVTDQVKAEGTRSTNQSGEGVEEKSATGQVVFERDFDADFAADQPWHHYPVVTTLGDDDKEHLKALVKDRVGTFKPDFAGVYEILKKNPQLKVADIRRAKCLDKAWAAGVRIVPAAPEDIELATTGGPAVVVRAKTGGLYAPKDPSALEKIKGDEMQMCAGVAIFGAYPPRLFVVRAPSGQWEIVQ